MRLYIFCEFAPLVYRTQQQQAMCRRSYTPPVLYVCLVTHVRTTPRNTGLPVIPALSPQLLSREGLKTYLREMRQNVALHPRSRASSPCCWIIWIIYLVPRCRVPSLSLGRDLMCASASCAPIGIMTVRAYLPRDSELHLRNQCDAIGNPALKLHKPEVGSLLYCRGRRHHGANLPHRAVVWS